MSIKQTQTLFCRTKRPRRTIAHQDSSPPPPIDCAAREISPLSRVTDQPAHSDSRQLRVESSRVAHRMIIIGRLSKQIQVRALGRPASAMRISRAMFVFVAATTLARRLEHCGAASLWTAGERVRMRDSGSQAATKVKVSLFCRFSSCRCYSRPRAQTPLRVRAAGQSEGCQSAASAGAHL